MKFFFYFFFFLFCAAKQTDYPKDYFRSPLDIPMQLSGNFGELRPNHFHAGFDLRLTKRGFKSICSGRWFVSRIKISTFGNGKQFI
jgi:hypothetical protein